MTMHREWMTFEDNGTTYRAYASRLEQAKTPLPIVLVIQEIWGVDAHIQEVTDRYAKAGYLAVAPDLFSVNGERPAEFTDERIQDVKAFLDTVPPTAWHNPDEMQAAMDALEEPRRSQIRDTHAAVFSVLPKLPSYVAFLRASVNHFQNHEWGQGQKVGSVGFCMGGALSGLLAASEPKLSAAAVYYGMLPTSNEQVESIQCPVAGFFGEHDAHINERIPAFVEMMERHDKSFTYHVYDGAHHAFFNDTRASYNADAARDAFAKTLTFFRENLV